MWILKLDNQEKCSKAIGVFHNRCLMGILGITAGQQQTEHLSSVQIGTCFGMAKSLEDLITAKRLKCLGHLTKLDKDRIPKRKLFGWLSQQRRTHGNKTRWRDRARKDLKKFDIEEGSWYKVPQERGSWKGRCHVGLENATYKKIQEDEMRKRRKDTELSSEVSSKTGEATALPFNCDTCQTQMCHHSP